MSYALTQAIWVSISSLFFVTVHLAFGRKTAARPLYILGLILAISFILPVKLPLLRMEIPESTALEAVFSAESAELPALPDNTANGTDTIYPGVSAPQVPTANEKESVFPTETVVLAIYLAGVFATLFCTFYRYCRAVKTLQRCGRAPTEREKRIFTELCRKQGVSRMPRLLVCPESAIGSSVMFGFIKQTVLIADGLKEEDLALILGHELTHCKRKDPIMKAFLAFLGAIYWFNPAVFLFNRTMHRLCEESCDETLLRGSSQESKIQYCRLLVAAASARNAENKAIMTSFKGGKKTMKKRLENILNTKSKVVTAVVIVSLLLVTMLTSAIYFTLPADNVKVAYLDSWDKVWSSLDDKDTVTSDFTIEYEYSLDSDIITVTGAVNGKAFEVAGKLAYANHNGAKLFYDFTADQKGNYNVKHLSLQLAQYTEIDGEKFGAPEGYNWDHALKAFFETYAKENPNYKNMLALYLNPVDTDDIVVIEIFIEEDFVTKYSETHDVSIQTEYNPHLNWFVYWYAENGAFTLDETLTPPAYITIDKTK